jgi:DNA replication protein DnaC
MSTTELVKVVDNEEEAVPTLSGSLTCSTCGKTFSLVVEGLRIRSMRALIERQIAGTSPAWCSDCIAEDEARTERQWQAERVEKLRGGRLARSGIPPKWQAASLTQIDEDPLREEAIRRARRWSEGRGSLGVLLYGEVGVGKSHIAGAAAMARLNVGRVRWISVAELLMGMRMPFASQAYKDATRALEVGRSDIALVLDDLDKIAPTEQAVQPLYLAINRWIEARQPLLVTMNRSLEAYADDLPERFGDAIGSRLAEHCVAVRVGGTDRRLG